MASLPRAADPMRCPALLRGVFGGLALLVAVAGAAHGDVTAEPLQIDVPGLGPLVLSVNGQTLYGLDERTGEVVAIDPLDPAAHRVAVTAPDGAPRPVALACIDTSTIVAVCRAGDAWSVRSWRVPPDGPADGGSPLQSIPLDSAAAAAPEALVCVSHSRNWLAVTGPAAPLLRGVIAGLRIGGLTDRAVPDLAGSRPVAMTTSPVDELVLALQDPQRSAGPTLTFVGVTGRPLLRLDSGLESIAGLAFSGDGSTLWAIGTAATGGGLWRLDAALEGTRQVVRPALVLPLEAVRGIACLGDKAVFVSHGAVPRRLSRILLRPGETSGRASPPARTTP